MNFRFNYKPCTNLTLENISIIREDTVIVKKISFNIQSRQSLWLKGRNGSGKTTLLKLISGLFNSYYGKILYNGKEINTTNHENTFAWLDHKNALSLGLNVKEEIDLYCYNKQITPPNQKIWNYIGLNHIIKLNTTKLSSGQSRLLALFRIFLSNLPIWLLDEPEDCLDSHGKLILKQSCQAHLKYGGIIIVVSHHKPSWLCQLKFQIT